MKIDLHTHSTNSDWEKTPNELLDIAKSKNCEWFVITDYDTFDIWVNKLEEFENFSQKAKILWINWIEINLKAPEIWVEKTLEIAKKTWYDFNFLIRFSCI